MILRRLLGLFRRKERVQFPPVFTSTPKPPGFQQWPPSVKVEPLSVVLHYDGCANHTVVREAFTFGQWCGENNIVATVKTPGDRTVRICFEHPSDEMMFRVMWGEKIMERGPRRH